MDLRQAIVERVHNKSEEELIQVIDNSINGEEQALPGIGVLFELIWQHSDASMKQQLSTMLHEQLQAKGTAATTMP